MLDTVSYVLTGSDGAAETPKKKKKKKEKKAQAEAAAAEPNEEPAAVNEEPVEVGRSHRKVTLKTQFYVYSF